MNDIELMREALRRLPAHVLNSLATRKLSQERTEADSCSTVQQLRAQRAWERSCDAGR